MPNAVEPSLEVRMYVEAYMPQQPMTPELALRLRERGLNIYGENHAYSTPRLKEVAKRQAELLAEFELLDKEIEQMAEKLG